MAKLGVYALALGVMALVASSPALAETAPASAADTDPLKLGWMLGSPPPPEKRIQFSDGSFITFPKNRWSFAHYQELFPTARIARGKGPVAVLPVATRADIAQLSFTPKGESKASNWVEAFDALYGDAIVVLHRGRIVFEKYNGVMNVDQPHIGFSLTKSFYGTLAEMMIAEGTLDERKTVAHYLPELADSGFGDATVRQVLDMTTSLDYNEDADDAAEKMRNFSLASGTYPRPIGYNGPTNTFDLLKTVKKVGPHGARFDYQSLDTEVLGFIIGRIAGKRPEKVLEERIWSQLGAENDANIVLDEVGSSRSAGGLSATARDFARFGEMMRRNGKFNGKQIVPAKVVAKIRAGGSKRDFANAIWDYNTRRGWSYKSQWWHTHNADKAFMGIGMFGQAIYVDPKAEMVIVRFMSGPDGSTVGFDPITQGMFQAMADHLSRSR
ncbi:serine hydrolase domain-containing protein [Aquisediminimonas profunda]|uniref:serine hydrolase domain-containing protein n=1 Tax=Aquisediminimonas profunda TaxID=1550733 RepID=UPI001C6301BF|nr:serine hydrolase [Aquisediminimonas profunda]